MNIIGCWDRSGSAPQLDDHFNCEISMAMVSLFLCVWHLRPKLYRWTGVELPVSQWYIENSKGAQGDSVDNHGDKTSKDRTTSIGKRVESRDSDCNFAPSDSKS